MNAKKAAFILALLLGILILAAFLLRRGNPETGKGERKDSRSPEGTAPIVENPSTGTPGKPGTPGTRETPSVPTNPRPPGTRPSGSLPGPLPPISRPVLRERRTSAPTKVERAGTGTVHGTVKASVTPLPQPPTDVRGWPHCAELYPAGIPSEKAVIDGQRRVRWALLRVVSELPEAMRSLPSERVQLSFSKCRYRPRVLALRDAIMLPLSNEDTAPHHYELTGAQGTVSFNKVLKPGEKTGVRFAPERDFVRFGCRLHPWESAWVTVLSHPFSFVTGENGKYGLANLPPGRYTIEAWHESFQSVVQEVTVEEDKALQVDFTLDRLKR